MVFKVGDSIGELVKQPDEVQMFTFAAAAWNQHRIHYDRDRARSEGHADLVVDNAMRASWLAQLIEIAGGRGTRLTRLTYRHVAPAYVNQAFTVRGAVNEVDTSTGSVVCELTITGPAGEVTRGTARFEPGNTPT